MGIIKATFNAIGGNLADSWLEVLEADEMSDTTVFTKAVAVRRGERRNNNKRGSSDVISNGSVIHVYPNQFMILTEGGKIIDYTAEEGYYKVDNSSAPSLFNGQFGEALADAFRRIKFSGTPSYAQKAYFINLQEIKGIKFGTRTPVNYFDNFYNSELFLRAHGNYSIKVTDPIKFYSEVIPKNAERVDINQINEQYLSEFLEALSAAINNMSADGIRISYVAGKSRELSKYMATELDEDWKNTRGFEIQSVGIASVSYDEDSKELINMRNKGAMLGDAAVREGYVQGSVARGFEAAGSNSAGASQAFVGMGMGMGSGGGFMASASETNRRQMEIEREKAESKKDSWHCACGNEAEGKFCSNCGVKKPAPVGSWTCSCGNVATGKFCSECGAKAPEAEWFCSDCGAKNEAGARFCSNCGKKK
ncbi:MAG: zinc-ribbon domain-containing protein [Ruminococcaceae bacterium]|nr:zinc-ribbon domain-containing protein [Oscillospiraceae bacterium]